MLKCESCKHKEVCKYMKGFINLNSSIESILTKNEDKYNKIFTNKLICKFYSKIEYNKKELDAINTNQTSGVRDDGIIITQYNRPDTFF